MKSDFNDCFIITKNESDKISKNEIMEKMSKYKWNNILTMLKSLSLNYKKDNRLEGQKGIIYGIKRND
jgi:hypothetical protein